MVGTILNEINGLEHGILHWVRSLAFEASSLVDLAGLVMVLGMEDTLT